MRGSKGSLVWSQDDEVVLVADCTDPKSGPDFATAFRLKRRFQQALDLSTLDVLLILYILGLG